MSLHFDERDRESVIRDLASGDEEVRRLAVERVGALPSEEVLGHLIERLGDEAWRVRKVAVERLVAFPDPGRAVDALVGALADGENPGRRNAAVEALVQAGARVLPRLVEESESADADVRKLVVDALAAIGDARAVPAVVRRLAGDPDANVRAAAADALGALGGDAGVRGLRDAALRADEDPLVRYSALCALATLDVAVPARDLAPLLDHPVLAPAGLALLGCSGEREAVALLEKGLASRSRTCREAAMRSLLRLLAGSEPGRAERLADEIREACAASPELIESAVERLASADLPTRLVLVQFLGLLGAKEAVVPILLAGRDEALSQVALAALQGLGEIADAALDRHWSGLDGDARSFACAVFGRLHGEGSAARLLAALGDRDPALRASAARSIGERRLGAALPALVHRLGLAAAEGDLESEEEVAALTESLVALAKPGPGVDPSHTEQAITLLCSHLEAAGEEVRLALARVLGCIGRQEDAALVAMLLGDPSSRVRRAAVGALARLDPGSAAEPLRLALADESPVVRIAAADALGASESDPAIENLTHLADDREPRVRAAAVRVIALRFLRSADAKRRAAACALVERAVADEASVALAAGEALREVGGPDVRLARALLARPEPEVVQEGVRCLAADPAAADFEVLFPLVSHPDWSVRAEVIQALSDRGVARAVPPILRRLEVEQDEFVRGVILRALERLEA